MVRSIVTRVAIAALLAGGAVPVRAQGAPASPDSLVRLAINANPDVAAARARAAAAHARIAPAGARPDPVLVAGVQNVPVNSFSFTQDEMTMAMVGLSQTLPASGKRALRTDAMQREADAADALVAGAEHAVAREVREAYAELVTANALFALTARSQQLVAAMLPTADARYATGGATQSDVLRLRGEAARLAGDAAALAEDQRALLARLNAALDRPGDAPIVARALPTRVLRAALGDTAGPVRFASASLGARVVDAPWPPLDSLGALAVDGNAALRAHESMIAAQGARAALAAKEGSPDVDVSLQYGVRAQRPNMLSALISLPLPIQSSRKQDASASAARAELEALHAEHRADVNRLHADVARLVGTLERDRAQLALYRTAVLPPARATATSLTASFTTGRTPLGAVIDAQSAALLYEMQYVRLLGEFAKALAELEQLTGTEVVR